MGTRAHPVHAPESGIGKHGSTNSHGRGTLFRGGVGSRGLRALAFLRHVQIVVLFSVLGLFSSALGFAFDLSRRLGL